MMEALHTAPVSSFLMNEQNALAIETAVREAVASLVEVITSININALRSYQDKIAETSKENETLRLTLQSARAELRVLRHRRCLQSCPTDFAASSESNSNAGSFLESEGELTESMRRWKRDPESPRSSAFNLGTETVEDGSTWDSDQQGSEIHAGISVHPDGVVGSLAAVDCLIVKEEPSDTDTFYIKCEMSEEGLPAYMKSHVPLHAQCEAGSTAAPKNDHLSCQRHFGAPAFDNRYRSSVRQRERLPMTSKTKNQTSKASSIERQRRYREKLRADPERHRAYLEQQRNRNMSRRKLINDLPEHVKIARRKAWRENARRCRARKKLLLQMLSVQQSHLTQSAT